MKATDLFTQEEINSLQTLGYSCRQGFESHDYFICASKDKYVYIEETKRDGENITLKGAINYNDKITNFCTLLENCPSQEWGWFEVDGVWKYTRKS